MFRERFRKVVGPFIENPPEHVGQDRAHQRIIEAHSFGWSGVVHSVAIGRWVADLLTDGAVSLPLAEKWRPERFDSGSLEIEDDEF